MAQSPRVHCAQPLSVGQSLGLDEGAARHVQVLRLQPGDAIVLFGGPAADDGHAQPGEYPARIERIGRQDVQVRIEAHVPVDRESARRIRLAIGMPANERMDWLVEKATELGVAAIQPLMTERTVVRLDAERAERRVRHWTAIAIAACEQCGRNRVPRILAPSGLVPWLAGLGPVAGGARWMLSFGPDAMPLARAAAILAGSAGAGCDILCGPEGGLSAQEEAAAERHGFLPASLGPRVLRAETAALVALTLVA